MAAAFRITQEKFKTTAFNGEGAFQYAGRWNSVGTRMVYTAESRALACLEILVHTDSPTLLKTSYVIIEIEVPDNKILEPPLGILPTKWPESGALNITQSIGDQWIAANRSVAMWVPSSVIPNERNLLLNPTHQDFAGIHIQEPLRFPFDKRLA